MPPYSKGPIRVSSNLSLTYPLTPIKFEFQHLTTHDPALLPVVIKASHQCIVESVRILTKFQLRINSSYSLSPSISLQSGILWTSIPPTAVLTVPLQNTGPNDLSGAVLLSVQHQNSDPRIPTTQAPSKTFHPVFHPPTTLVPIFGTLCLNSAPPSPLCALIQLP